MACWREVQQCGDRPGPRSSHSLAAPGHRSDKLILFGGELEPRCPVPNDTYELTLASGQWRKLEVTGDVPSPRIAPTMAGLGDAVYLFGGRQGVQMGEGALGDLYRLDVATAVWTRLDAAASGPAPPVRSFHAMAEAGGKLFIFGGCGSSGRLNDLHSYDSATATWEALPTSDAIVGRGGACLVATADAKKLLVIGGFCGKELGDTHVFDLESLKWEVKTADMKEADAEGAEATGQLPPRSVFGAWTHRCSPEAVAGAAAQCHHAGHVVAFGGEVDPSDKGHSGAGQFSQDTFSCDLATSEWHALPLVGGPTPQARGWFGSAVADGSLVVFGGLDVDNKRLDDLWLLNPHSA